MAGNSDLRTDFKNSYKEDEMQIKIFPYYSNMRGLKLNDSAHIFYNAYFYLLK